MSNLHEIDGLETRFWSKVKKTKSCWEWTAATIRSRHGDLYGHFYVETEREGSVMQLAHRVSYELAYGPIPEGLTADHLCRNTLCVRPDHLEVVTLKENILRGEGFSAINARKKHCLRGHPFSGSNLIVNVRGDRVCRICENATQRSSRRRVRV